jgi:hypothetical protein
MTAGRIGGMGIEPAKVRQLRVLNPEQFDQVKARVEGLRAARGEEVIAGRGMAGEPLLRPHHASNRGDWCFGAWDGQSRASS